MPKYICSGAKLKCSMGDSQSELSVVHLEKPVNLHGKPMASIMDYKPMLNIKPFGRCQSLLNPTVAMATAANFGVLQPLPCIPNTTAPWLQGHSSFTVKGQPALLDNCKLMCAYAGVIEITDAGQTTVQTGAERVEGRVREQKVIRMYWMDEKEEKRIETIKKGETAVLYVKTRNFIDGDTIHISLWNDETNDKIILNGTVNAQGLAKIQWKYES